MLPVQLPPSSPPTMTTVPRGSEDPTQPSEGGVSGDVDDEVVALVPVGEVLAGVVDDVVGAE